MTVRRLNSPVKPMDPEFCSLILADLPASIYGLTLRVIVSTGSLCSAALYVPTAVRIMNHMMCSFCHAITPYVLEDSRWRSHLHLSNAALLR